MGRAFTVASVVAMVIATGSASAPAAPLADRMDTAAARAATAVEPVQIAQAADPAAKARSDQLMARQTFQFPLGEWLLQDVAMRDAPGLYSTIYTMAHPAAVGQLYYAIAKGDYVFGDLIGVNAQADWLNGAFNSIGTVTGRQLELINNGLGGTRVAFLKSKQGQNCAFLFSFLGERDQVMGVMCGAPTLAEPAFQGVVRSFVTSLKRIT